MAFVLVLVTNVEITKTATYFLALETPSSYLNNDLFYCNSSSDLILVQLNTFFPTKIVYCIDLRGQNTKNISIGVFFITFLSPSVFFLLFSNLVGGFYGLERIGQRFRLLNYWLRLFSFKVFRVVHLF